jgi:uncharacterized protein (DUF111 family)
MTPIVMKKSRPGTKLTLLCAEQTVEVLLAVLFDNSTTIGVRVHQVDKRMLPRTLEAFETSLGQVQVKSVRLPNGKSRWKIEHDDIERIAAAHALPYLDVAKRLQIEVHKQQEPHDER